MLTDQEGYVAYLCADHHRFNKTDTTFSSNEFYCEENDFSERERVLSTFFLSEELIDLRRV